MKILLASSEAVPFAKSGGLADVAGSLAMAVRNRQHACRVVLPLYQDIPQSYREKMKFVTSFYVPLGWRNQYCGVFECTVGGLKYYLLDNEYYFRRAGLYGFYDDGERFAFFSKAVLEMVQHIDFKPDILHCNDWQTALVPVYLNAFYRHLEDYKNIKTLFTIHNIQYQGVFDKQMVSDVLGLPGHAQHIVEFAGDVNYMKGAIDQCDLLSTVSPTYACEILDPWYAHGLDSLLRDRQYKLHGILNGIDYTEYNPETDPKIICNYSANNLAGKAANKRELQNSLGLSADPDAMVIGVVSRLVSHKGMDLIQYAFGRIMQENVQFVLLGSGDWQYEKFFREAVSHYPRRVAVHLGFDSVLSQKIYSGADAYLMPSRSEPCGLSQMIALRYGTVPIVRLTGGLKDSVTDLGGETGNGYTFQTYNGEDMLWAISRAATDFADKEKWQSYVTRAMNCDFSWGKSANQYIALYKRLLEQ